RMGKTCASTPAIDPRRARLELLGLPSDLPVGSRIIIRRCAMRILTVLGAAALALTINAGGAKAAAWCAYYDADTYNCGFYTYGQCLATISGVGGYCQPNYRAGAYGSQRYRPY